MKKIIALILIILSTVAFSIILKNIMQKNINNYIEKNMPDLNMMPTTDREDLTLKKKEEQIWQKYEKLENTVLFIRMMIIILVISVIILFGIKGNIDKKFILIISIIIFIIMLTIITPKILIKSAC